MKRKFIAYALVSISLLSSSSAFAATFSNTFDNGNEGWQVGDIDNQAGSRENPIFNNTGGNPGGYISTTDDYNIVGFFAPSSVDGNRSSFYGGTVSFDLQDKVPADGPAYPALFLYGDGKVISIAGSAPGTTFTHYSFSLTQTGFFNYTGGGESPGTTPVTEAEFKAVLGNLTDIAILADWHSGSDLTGLDNVVVASATVSSVPLPASAPMFGAALLALAGFSFGMNRWVAPKGKKVAARA